MRYTLRKASKSDIDFLLGLRDITMGKYLQECGMPTTQDAYLERVLYEFEYAQIIEVNGNSAGLFKTKFDSSLNEWYLVQIQIHPSYQNHKIATHLISKLITDAHANGSSVGLSVVKTNPAKQLYQRLGFVQTGENQFEYLMKKLPENLYPKG